MPTLKQLTCNLEWTGSGTPLTEYQTAYSDGFVETFVAVPSIPTPFSVRLRSHGYIAPGLAMFVYMDGQYQCNRNRRNLRMPDGTSSRKHTEINFHVRQKEDMLEDGTFIGKEWRFEKLNVVSGDAQQLSHKAPHDAEHVGMIEVVVLRCHPISKELATGKMCESQPESLSKKPTGAANSGKTAKAATPPTPSDDSSTSSESSGPFLGMFDGAGDEAPNEFNGMAFGGDAGWDNPIPQASNGTQQWGASMTSPNRGAHPPAAEGPGSAAGRVIDPQWHGRDQSRHHFKQDWSQSGRPSSQTSQSRNSPQLQQQGSSGSFSGDKAANRSISGSKRTAPSNAGRAAGLGTTVPVTPAVIIDITQADPQPGIWGLTSAVPAASEVDSWATRQTPYDYGQEDGQARQEAVQARQPNDSWQAPTAWSEGGGNGQPSEDKKELSNESAGGNSLAIPQTSNKADNAGNQGPKDTTWNTANTGTFTASGGWPGTSNGDTSGNSGAWESNKRNSWDTISPSEGMPGAWWSNDDPKSNDTTGWGKNATHGAQENQGARGEGNETSNAARNENSGGAHGSAVFNSGEQNWGGKKECTSSGWGNNNNTNTQNWAWGEDKKIDASSNQSEDKAGPSALEVKAGPGSEKRASKFDLGGETSQSKGWVLPSNKVQGKPSLLSKIRSRLGSSPLSASPTNLAEQNKKQHGMPGSSTDPGSGPLAAGILNAPIPPQPSLQQQRFSGKQPPQQAPVAGTGPVPLAAAESYRKPYWSTWNHSDAKSQSAAGDGHSDMYLGSLDPLYTIPEEVVRRKNMSHQVHPGRPVLYAHKTSNPKYMDSHESPYAIFVFKYRSEDTIEKLLSVKVTENEDEEKRRLHSLSKAEIIEHFMRAKARENTSQSGADPGWQTVSTPNNATEGISVASPKSVQTGQEAWSTKNNNNDSNAGDGIDFSKVAEKLGQLQTSPNSSSDNGSSNPDRHWGRDGQNPQWSNNNAGDWNSNSKNNNNKGGNWNPSNSTGNSWGGGGGGQI
ncbi:hypothetical protein MMC08_008654, partial [Hypocenomyce scalaris]|nr:hypothetical protein [Hypocenomyce scalaris]